MGSKLMEYGGWRYEERVGGCDLNRALMVCRQNRLEDDVGLVCCGDDFDESEVIFFFAFFFK